MNVGWDFTEELESKKCNQRNLNNISQFSRPKETRALSLKETTCENRQISIVNKITPTLENQSENRKKIFFSAPRQQHAL